MRNGFDLPEIERALVSCAMQWPDKVFPIIDEFRITSEHIQTPQNRVLFDCVRNFYTNGKPLDLICFTQELDELEILKSAGGAVYVTSTWCVCYSPDAAEYYSGLLQEAHARRIAEATFGDSIAQIRQPMAETEIVVSQTVEKLSAIPTKHRKHRTLLEAVTEKMERMERGEESGDIIKTGIRELDNDSPLRRGDMPLIVGERKSGKSILALTLATNIANFGRPVLIFSLEDREPKLIDRLVAGLSRLPIHKHKTCQQDSNEIRRSLEALTKLKQLPIYIKDDVFTLEGIQSVTRELKARCKVELVIVDYGQLVRVPDRKDTNRQQEVAEVSRNLRLLAMELDTPIIVISQLNSDGYTRESRSLEQDATACWELKSSNEKEENQNMRWIHIPWQRNGRSGIRFKVTFLGDIARVENYQSDE